MCQLLPYPSACQTFRRQRPAGISIQCHNLGVTDRHRFTDHHFGKCTKPYLSLSPLAHILREVLRKSCYINDQVTVYVTFPSNFATGWVAEDFQELLDSPCNIQNLKTSKVPLKIREHRELAYSQALWWVRWFVQKIVPKEVQRDRGAE